MEARYLSSTGRQLTAVCELSFVVEVAPRLTPVLRTVLRHETFSMAGEDGILVRRRAARVTSDSVTCEASAEVYARDMDDLEGASKA